MVSKTKTFMKIIKFKGEIHPDGDVYVEGKNKMYYIGAFSELTVGEVPDEYYEKIKKISNLS